MIYYTEDHYPCFYPGDEMPPIIGFINNDCSEINIIYHVDRVYEVLLNSGLTPKEIAEFFVVNDIRDCRLDKELHYETMLG